MDLWFFTIPYCSCVVGLATGGDDRRQSPDDLTSPLFALLAWPVKKPLLKSERVVFMSERSSSGPVYCLNLCVSAASCSVCCAGSIPSACTRGGGVGPFQPVTRGPKGTQRNTKEHKGSQRNTNMYTLPCQSAC